MKRILILFVITFFGGSFVHAQDKKDDPTRWTPEDIINTEYLGNASFSPDNKMVVWTKRKGVKEKDKFVSDIYLTRLDIEKKGKFKTVQLTNKEENDYAPLFSKDSETIYFLSSRDKGKKLWSMSIFGGEPKKVHEFKNGITSMDWLNDSTLVFRSNEGKTLHETELEKEKDNTVVVEDSLHWKANRVYSFDIKKKTISRLSSNKKPVAQFAVSRDGQWLVYSMSMSRHYASDQNPDNKYFLKNLKSGSEREILNGLQTPGGFNFTTDHKGFYFMTELSSDPEWNGAGITELYYYDLGSYRYQKVALNWENGIGGGIDIVGNDVIASLANRATRRLAFYKKRANGWTKQEINQGDKNDHTSVLAVSEDGSKILYDYSTASKLPEYYVADRTNNSITNDKILTSLNAKLKSKPRTKSEIMTWKGYKGEEVTGILYYPENYETGKRYPLMLSIHGGPASADTDSWRERWSTYPNILAQRGAFVLKPNYHGSGNHGLSYVESIKENYYEPEMEDIMKGIDVLDQKGMIDKSKMGTMGWSAGAIITTMLTVRYPDAFKVACPGAGDVNWTSDFGTCRFGVSFDQSYFGGAPWDDINGKYYNENYILKSPLFELEKVKTPTIIFHGSEDRAVPRDQGWEYYRAMQQVDKAPVRFLWFPGQPHGLQKITHQLRKMKEELVWIDKYLFEKEEKKNEALKKDSPLAMLLEKGQVKRSGQFYGEMKSGVLIPETVAIKKDSISIGRFELTNAQFKQFRSGHTFDESQYNYPALISFSDAQAYAKWLSTKTGAKYRLPNEKESKSFHEKAKKVAPKENTLNYWAGYDITIDEVNTLLEKVVALKSPMLKEAGQFKCIKVGEADVYDLGGNVAEYDSSGKSYGYGAKDFVDGHSEERSTGSLFGMRLVLE